MRISPHVHFVPSYCPGLKHPQGGEENIVPYFASVGTKDIAPDAVELVPREGARGPRDARRVAAPQRPSQLAIPAAAEAADDDGDQTDDEHVEIEVDCSDGDDDDTLPNTVRRPSTRSGGLEPCLFDSPTSRMTTT